MVLCGERILKLKLRRQLLKVENFIINRIKYGRSDIDTDESHSNTGLETLADMFKKPKVHDTRIKYL